MDEVTRKDNRRHFRGSQKDMPHLLLRLTQEDPGGHEGEERLLKIPRLCGQLPCVDRINSKRVIIILFHSFSYRPYVDSLRGFYCFYSCQSEGK